MGALAAVLPLLLRAQSPIVPQGVEYPIAGSIPGDQVFARLAVNPSGGYVVWEDNFIDGEGYGIGARRLDSSLAGTLATLRINDQAAGDQERPQVALLKNGGAVFAWQGGPLGFPKIYARFLDAKRVFATGDVLVNTYQQGRQEDPHVAVLTDGTVVVVWSSYGQDGSYDGVFGQRLTAQGAKQGGEFPVTQTTLLNQRSPAVAASPDGGYVVVWISERETANRPNVDVTGVNSAGGAGVIPLFDVSVYGRRFGAAGPLSDEFKINSSAIACANPVISTGVDGGFLVAWSGHTGPYVLNDLQRTDGWDVYGRAFSADGTPAGPEARFNEEASGDQFLPSIATCGANFLAAWVSLGQDGSREGVYARLVSSAGAPAGSEFRVNTTTIGPQKLPDVASDGASRCLVVWSGTMGGLASFDLFAQRYATTPQPVAPAKPFVWAPDWEAVQQSASLVTPAINTTLRVSWPDLSALGATAYEVYKDASTSADVVTTNTCWRVNHLTPATAYFFRLAYVLKSGERSPLSDVAVGTTWGWDDNYDGLPDDWQMSYSAYWGSDPSHWPPANADSDGDGATNMQEFLAGTSPIDPQSVLRLNWATSGLVPRLSWNTEPGFIYQVQVSYDMKKWVDLGLPRFALGKADSIPTSPGSGEAVYRIIRVR